MNRKHAIGQLIEAEKALGSLCAEVEKLRTESDRLREDAKSAGAAEEAAHASLVQATADHRLGDQAAGARAAELLKTTDAKSRDRTVFAQAAGELERRIEQRLEHIEAAKQAVRSAGREVAALLEAELREELPRAARGLIQFVRKVDYLRPLLAQLGADTSPYAEPFVRVFGLDSHELAQKVPATDPLSSDAALVAITSGAQRVQEADTLVSRAQERIAERFQEQQRAKRALADAQGSRVLQ